MEEAAKECMTIHRRTVLEAVTILADSGGLAEKVKMFCKSYWFVSSPVQKYRKGATVTLLLASTSHFLALRKPIEIH